MVAAEPDVGLLTSSAQIFSSKHTLPQIRAIHKSLHVQVDDKATRLRTQVGGSYRELLGTAETIVQMRTDMEGAQSTLAGMGGRCGRAVVGGKVTALASFVDHEQGQSALSLAARARLLEACSRTVGRLLSRSNPDYSAGHASKTGKSARQQRNHYRQQRQQQQQYQSWGERLMLASKVLVLSRLLLSGINDTNGDPPRTISRSKQAALQDAAVLASIEASKRSLGSLRRRLRDMIEVVERAVPASALDKSTAAADDADEVEDVDVDDDNNNRIGGGANDEDEDNDGSITREQRDRHHTVSAAASARDDLLRALCAHSLATTSGARDVLWQLLHVRSQAMALAFEMDEEEHQNNQQSEPGQQQQQQQPSDHRASWKADNVLRGLALYTKTLLDVQALLPHRLPEALLGLKRRALLDDDALRQVEGLRLDVYARWCGEDVQYFKPYIRHDDLDATQARDMLAKWAERGSEVFVAGLQRALEQQPPADASSEKPAQGTPLVIRRYLDMHAIVDLRTRVLQLWIRDSSKARGFDPSELLDKIRAVFNQQMLQVLATKAGKLRLVGSEVAATLASWQDGVTDRHAQLWGTNSSSTKHDDHQAIDTDLSEGAVAFVRDVVTRLHGRSDAVAKAVASYVTWRHVVDDVAAVVDQLRRQRWDNDVDDIVEDEDTIAQRQQLLSKDDPQTLHDRLEAALDTAFQELNAQITTEWAAVASSDDLAPTTKGNIAMYLVRVLREIRSRRPATSSASAATRQLGLAIIPELHAAIVRVVVAPPLEQFTRTTLTRKTVAGRVLWDAVGQSAALPSTPSPGVFKFLRDLSTAMGTAGMDLWSPAAVAQLKQQVSQQLGEQWTALLETADYLQEDSDTTLQTENQKEASAASGGEKQDAASTTTLSTDDRKDLLKQWLFDVAWLRCSLGSDAGKTDKTKKRGMVELEDAVFRRTGLPEEESNDSGSKTPRQRITKAAQEYWKKTSLLFGLLA
ncbi:hypothetical protein HMPREF1624_05974 [Sporothrix schenckii ATCC 58251]|uniref:Conserved oligomeric Golgi complex subunit 1 n=1 Tax=Sporothrix schenckii (strain ATCC 58251 / de Perez 2211183) TaxID=1391915 RepID=U7PQ86_SPOS1|nr:hypothetical protein HMPREF1624_05974 [Sporothrix schenckii ATCC 58251]